MKKILYTCFAAFLFLGACTTGVDDDFDKTASERLQEKVEECRSLLLSNTNGWLIQYYPSYSQSFGGFNFVAGFGSDGYVEVNGDIAAVLGDDVSKSVLSHYSVNTASGVTLIFDTYNKYIHYLSDPDYTSANDYGGDYTFTYVSGNKEEMIFKGIKTENTIVFKALSTPGEGVEYLAGATAIRNATYTYKYFIWRDSNGNETELSQNESATANILSYYATEDADAPTNIPYIFTSTGIQCYSAITIDGVTVRHFDWDATANAYISTDAVNSAGETVTVSLSGKRSDKYISYDDLPGMWKMNYHYGTEDVKFTEKEYGSSLYATIKGYNVVVKYQRFGEYISIVSQPLKGQISLIPWCAEGGFLSTGANIGMNFSLDTTATQKVLVGEDNGVWGSEKVDGFLVIDFTGFVPGTGNYSVIEKLPYIKTFIQ